MQFQQSNSSLFKCHREKTCQTTTRKQ